MRMPAIISIIFPVIAGFLFGPYFVGGLLIGATLSAIMLAIFTGNAGGAWDNGKKYIESGAIEGQGKGSPAHDAAVVGDTVGDPLKDTVGPSLDILIKIMSTVSLVAAVMFYNYTVPYLWYKIIFRIKELGRQTDWSAAPVFMYIYFMNLTLGYIAFLASSFLSLNVTLFCSKRLSPLASIDTISGPNSLTLQHHNVSGIPSSSQ